MTPKILNQTSIFESKRFRIVSSEIEFDQGKTSWEHIEEDSDIILIVPIDENNNVYLAKEWRVAWQREISSIPGGKIHKNASEDEIVHKAHEELQEEVGMDAKQMIKLKAGILGPHYQRQFHLFLALDLFDSKKNADEFEFIKYEKVPLEQAISKVMQDDFSSSHSLLGLLLAKEYLNKNAK